MESYAARVWGAGNRDVRMTPDTMAGSLPRGGGMASEFVASSMRRNLTLLVLTVGLGLSALALAQSAQQHEQSSQAAQIAAADKAAAGHEEHGLPQQAIEIARPFGFAITNSMVVSWAVALGLIIFAQVATRHMRRIPHGAQNFWEWMVGGLSNFLEGIIGAHLVKRTFWYFATVFIFILFCNWMGLIPGVGTVGWNVLFSDGHTEWRPWLRGANADLNMTLAMAIVFFACWIIWSMQEVGPIGFLKELFAPKGDTTGFLKVLLIVVFLVAGLLEVVSILFRPISLSFRLYGNIFAGENMLETMAKLIPGLGWLLPIPFYFMELLVGLVQALVFMLLTAVFTLLMCQHEEATPSPAHA
jgi:F-type H+-transporting ATPase subunit a